MEKISWTDHVRNEDVLLRIKEQSTRYSCQILDLYGAETLTLRTVDQKHLESFEMWC